jgi:putative ABC transport system permease protein
MIVTTTRIALASLLRNRLRTALTLIAVGIGIAAVMTTAALGAAATDRVDEQINAVGEDFLWIRAGNRTLAGVRTGFGGARTLTSADSAAIAQNIPEISLCSPQMSAREQVIASGQNWNTRYQGVLPAFFEIRRRPLFAGAFFSDADVQAHARVLVLGMSVAERLFGDADPIGRVIRLGRFPFRVIGVLENRGIGRDGVDRDDAVFVPLTTAVSVLDRRTWVTDIMCAVRDPQAMDRAEARVTALLRERHDLTGDQPDDFQIQKPLEVLQLRAQQASTMGLLLTAIGGVSLVVGGVGIMNIMLVSVAERKREIGIRLAIGARVRQVRLQFLLEAAMLGLLGGVAGVGLGLLASHVVSAGFGWPTRVSSDVLLLSLAAAIGAGIVFGYYPAYRASSADPIDAIRTES